LLFRTDFWQRTCGGPSSLAIQLVVSPFYFQLPIPPPVTTGPSGSDFSPLYLPPYLPLLFLVSCLSWECLLLPETSRPRVSFRSLFGLGRYVGGHFFSHLSPRSGRPELTRMSTSSFLADYFPPPCPYAQFQSPEGVPSALGLLGSGTSTYLDKRLLISYPLSSIYHSPRCFVFDSLKDITFFPAM